MHDPGGRSLFPLQPGVSGAAYITPDGRHRLWLARVWGPGARYVAFLGLNPSTARPDMDDPTIRRDIAFAQRLGFDGMFKINIGTYRATDPKDFIHTPDPVHPENDHILRKVGGRCSKVIAAYGALHPKLRPLAVQAEGILLQVKDTLWCLGRTASGDPRHTLYLKSDAQLVPFP